MRNQPGIGAYEFGQRALNIGDPAGATVYFIAHGKSGHPVTDSLDHARKIHAQNSRQCRG